MSRQAAKLLLAVVIMSAVALLATACGEGDGPQGDGPQGDEPQELRLPVKVEGGGLDPETIRVKQGDLVTLAIESERTGQFHLHGYDLEKEVTGGETTDFFFIANATGRYRITMHYSGPAEGDNDGGGDHHEGSGSQDSDGDEAGHLEGADQDGGKSSSQGEEEINLGFLEVSPQ